MTTTTKVDWEELDGQTFGGAVLRVTPDRLTLRAEWGAWVKTLSASKLGGMIFMVVSLLLSILCHNWLAAVSLSFWALFSLFGVASALLGRSGAYVWDRAADVFTYNGVSVRSLSQIVGVETEHRWDSFQTLLVYADGVRFPVSAALSEITNAEEAERLRLALQSFLGLTRPTVWPPPPSSSGGRPPESRQSKWETRP